MPLSNYGEQRGRSGTSCSTEGFAADGDPYMLRRGGDEGGGHRHDLEWKFFQQQENLMHWTPQQTLFFGTTSNHGGQAIRRNTADELCDLSEYPMERPTKGPCEALQALQFCARDNQGFQLHGSAKIFSVSPSDQLQCTKAIRGKPRSRLSHKIVERRYRTNLNAQVHALRFTVPSLNKRPGYDLEMENGEIPAKPPTKAIIVSTAASYIQELQSANDRLLSHTKELQEQVEALQKLVQCNDCAICIVSRQRNWAAPRVCHY
jgi:hypothetical protein